METDDFEQFVKGVAESIKNSEQHQLKKYENVIKQATELFNNKQTAKFVGLYNERYASINEKTEALSAFLLEILKKENWKVDKILKFKEKILKAKDENFVYLINCAMFQCGVISPEEFIQSIEEGLQKQIPLAFVQKSFLYKYGLASFEPSKQAIEKAIMLEPNNLEYKKILKELEAEKALNDEYDSENNMF